MSNSKDSVKLELTPEQKAMIKNTTGKSADAVEFSVQELEERIAPGTLFPGGALPHPGPGGTLPNRSRPLDLRNHDDPPPA